MIILTQFIPIFNKFLLLLLLERTKFLLLLLLERTKFLLLLLLERTKLLLLQAQNSMQLIRKSSLFDRNWMQMQILTTRKFQVSIFRRILEIQYKCSSKKGRSDIELPNRFQSVPAILQTTEYKGDYSMYRSSTARIIWQVELHSSNVQH